jgi:hypothetical protein
MLTPIKRQFEKFQVLIAFFNHNYLPKMGRLDLCLFLNVSGKSKKRTFPKSSLSLRERTGIGLRFQSRSYVHRDCTSSANSSTKSNSQSEHAVPPEYVLLSTELGGEKRFSSTIARRLGSLGALTKGDRGAADNGDLAKYNFETEEGRAALSLSLRRIMKGENVPGLDNPRHTLRDIGLLVRDREGSENIRKEDEYNVPRFLNRVLALEVDQQNALFDYFADLFDQTVRYAKANGTFDEGVTDIKALAVRVAVPPSVVHTDEINQAQTTHYTLEVDVPSRAVSFEEAEAIRKSKSGAFLRHRKNGHFVLAVESGRHTDPATSNSYRTFAVWKPEAAHATYIHDDELDEKYKAVTPERARNWWSQKYDTIPPIETLETHIISGAIIPLWQRLKTNEDARLRVVRVITEDQQRIVGIQIPPDNVGAVLRSIGLMRDLREPDEIFYAVLDEGDEITLTSNLKLRRGSIHSEPAIELCGADPYKFAELRELGLIDEQINWKQRFFVPSDETSGIDILESLLERYPVMLTEDSVRDGESNMAEIPSQSQVRATEIVDLDQWIVAIGKATPEQRTADGSDRQVKTQEQETGIEPGQPFTLTQVAAIAWTQVAQNEQTQLAFSFG